MRCSEVREGGEKCGTGEVGRCEGTGRCAEREEW